jgi:hypothetical protein
MTKHHYESKSHPYGSGTSSEFGRHLDTAAEVTQDQREQMIAEAAYYIAEHRHFEGGDPLSDWLQAQSDIDSNIKHNDR